LYTLIKVEKCEWVEKNLKCRKNLNEFRTKAMQCRLGLVLAVVGRVGSKQLQKFVLLKRDENVVIWCEMNDENLVVGVKKVLSLFSSSFIHNHCIVVARRDIPASMSLYNFETRHVSIFLLKNSTFYGTTMEKFCKSIYFSRDSLSLLPSSFFPLKISDLLQNVVVAVNSTLFICVKQFFTLKRYAQYVYDIVLGRLHDDGYDDDDADESLANFSQLHICTFIQPT